MAVAVPNMSKGGVMTIIVPTAILTPFSVGIRFNVNSGGTSCTISERKLWVKAMAMTY
jgi:hypothetical protein